ncbi:MAG: hypothetical protein AAFV07_03545, partial [Bacteroidota bacterium]
QLGSGHAPQSQVFSGVKVLFPQLIELRRANALPPLLQTRQNLLIYASNLADQAMYAGEEVADGEVQSVIWELQELMHQVFEQREQSIRQAKP